MFFIVRIANNDDTVSNTVEISGFFVSDTTKTEPSKLTKEEFEVSHFNDRDF
ncbi:hypothetical protein AusDCA_2419 [Desulfitobacterium sp. AusDCA]